MVPTGENAHEHSAMKTDAYTPVIIIGAPRSGTNMLRDLMCQLPHTASWDCDEINYIWRFGNRSYPSDALMPEHATLPTQRFITKAFDRLHASTRATRIVEKTCANSLRVPFVNTIFPRAMFVFLVRDGRAVYRSALKRWSAPLDLRYLAQKARYVPPRDMLYYGYRYLRNRLGKVADSDGKLATWGPRFHGMEAFQLTHSFEACVAHQWVECVKQSQAALAQIPSCRRLSLSYEEIVANPVRELQRVTEFLQISATQEILATASKTVRLPETGCNSTADIPESVFRIMQPTLVQTGYLQGEKHVAA